MDDRRPRRLRRLRPRRPRRDVAAREDVDAARRPSGRTDACKEEGLERFVVAIDDDAASGRKLAGGRQRPGRRETETRNEWS